MAAALFVRNEAFWLCLQYENKKSMVVILLIDCLQNKWKATKYNFALLGGCNYAC